MDILMRFGKRVKAIRLQQNMSQEKLAELAGLHRTYISSVEQGSRNISLINIAAIAKALDVPIEKLVEEITRD